MQLYINKPVNIHFNVYSYLCFEVGTHEETSTCDQPCKQSSEQQFTRSILRNKSQGLFPEIQTGLNSWDQSHGPKFVLNNQILKQKWPFHTMGLNPVTSCRVQSASCVPTFMFQWNKHVLEIYETYFFSTLTLQQLVLVYIHSKSWPKFLYNDSTYNACVSMSFQYS